MTTFVLDTAAFFRLAAGKRECAAIAVGGRPRGPTSVLSRKFADKA